MGGERNEKTRGRPDSIYTRHLPDWASRKPSKLFFSLIFLSVRRDLQKRKTRLERRLGSRNASVVGPKPAL